MPYTPLQPFRYDQADPLPVMEQFYTLQGEGAYSGQAAYFIRLAGCDVGCAWCDVKESWEYEAKQFQQVELLAAQAAASGTNIVVVTGGEPAMYDLSLLTKALKAKGLRTHIETSGAHPLRGDWDWVCLSPKKFLKPREENFPLVHELKVIIYNKTDFKWAEEYAALCAPHTRLYLQAEWSKKAEMYPLMVDYIRLHPQWILSVQSHKYLDIP